jgi:hypothetical protein
MTTVKTLRNTRSIKRAITKPAIQKSRSVQPKVNKNIKTIANLRPKVVKPVLKTSAGLASVKVNSKPITKVAAAKPVSTVTTVPNVDSTVKQSTVTSKVVIPVTTTSEHF